MKTTAYHWQFLYLLQAIHSFMFLSDRIELVTSFAEGFKESNDVGLPVFALWLNVIGEFRTWESIGLL